MSLFPEFPRVKKFGFYLEEQSTGGGRRKKYFLIFSREGEGCTQKRGCILVTFVSNCPTFDGWKEVVKMDE
ncbi:hypothetical protein ABE51_15870 [Bacillus thuringiensis]|nr:hypothetical protein [Bacillus thuringiensis]